MTENVGVSLTALEAKLLDEAAANDEYPPLPVRSEDRAKVLAAIGRPDWDRANRIDDWQRWVQEITKNLWGELSLETKLVVFLMASADACRASDVYYDAKDRDR